MNSKNSIVSEIKSGGDFSSKVYSKLLEVPSGYVTTYGDLGRATFGDDFKGYRAIGKALNKNPRAPKVPCHRVVKGDGSLGGFAFGCEKKVEILAAEGVVIGEDGKVVDFKKRRWEFK